MKNQVIDILEDINRAWIMSARRPRRFALHRFADDDRLRAELEDAFDVEIPPSRSCPTIQLG